MDSLTQMTLGAAVGAALLSKGQGRKSLAVGAVLGTLPDMDVFIPYGDPVSNFTYHRSFSHALIVHLAITPFIVWGMSKIKWLDISVQNVKAYIAVFAILATHALLDAMTIYGTQLFWPLPMPPVGIGSIFIIDPLYTVPLLLCVLLYLIMRSHKVIMTGLVLSTIYLCWSVGAQYHVKSLVIAQVDEPPHRILVQPTALNTILWRIVVIEDDQYRVGYYSFFDNTTEIAFEIYESDPTILPDNWAVGRLQWFTKGFYGVRQEGNDVIVSDLRMGSEPNGYVFQFIVNKTPNLQYKRSADIHRLSGLWNRMIRDL